MRDLVRVMIYDGLVGMWALFSLVDEESCVCAYGGKRRR